jgi:hypothetical protein
MATPRVALILVAVLFLLQVSLIVCTGPPKDWLKWHTYSSNEALHLAVSSSEKRDWAERYVCLATPIPDQPGHWHATAITHTELDQIKWKLAPGYHVLQFGTGTILS